MITVKVSQKNHNLVLYLGPHTEILNIDRDGTGNFIDAEIGGYWHRIPVKKVQRAYCAYVTRECKRYGVIAGTYINVRPSA